MQLTLRIQGDSPEAVLGSLVQVAEDIRRSQLYSGQTQLSMHKRGWFANWKFEFFGNEEQKLAEPTMVQAAGSAKPIQRAVATQAITQNIVGKAFSSVVPSQHQANLIGHNYH